MSADMNGRAEHCVILRETPIVSAEYLHGKASLSLSDCPQRARQVCVIVACFSKRILV